MARNRTTRRLAGLLVALTLVGAACGGDDDSAEDAANDVADQIEDVLGGTLPGGGTLPEELDEVLADITTPEDLDDVLGDITIPEDLDELTDLTMPDLPDMPAMGDGSCAVDVTGDITASWTEEQNASSGLVSEWFTDAERELFGDVFTMLFNCSGEGGNFLSVSTANDASAEDVPHAPGTYALSGGGALGSTEGDVWRVIVTFGASDTNWGIAEEGGTLTVTEFDDDSIAFEIDAPLFDSLASLAGTPDQSAHLQATMTYTRP